MRVLLAHNRYRVAGGEEAHVAMLEAVLRAAGHETARFEASSPDEGGSWARGVGMAAAMTYSPAARRRMHALVSEWRPDVVHAHNLTPLLTPSVLHAARRAGIRVVLTVHNHRLFCPSGSLTRGGTVHDDCVTGSSLLCGLRNARGRWSESVAYGFSIELQRRLRLVDRWVDGYIAPSAYIAQMLRRAGFGAGRISVVPHGVPSSPWVPRRREFALVAGRLSVEKGLRTVLAAAKLAPEVPVVVAGDGPLAAEVRRANGSVRYLGLLDRAEVASAQERAAFSVVASECPEVFPLAAVESLAAGTPVVATRIGGLPEIVATDTDGVLVAPGDAPALARSMRELWDRAGSDPDHGHAAWESAAVRFSLETQIERTLGVYRGDA